MMYFCQGASLRWLTTEGCGYWDVYSLFTSEDGGVVVGFCYYYIALGTAWGFLLI